MLSAFHIGSDYLYFSFQEDSHLTIRKSISLLLLDGLESSSIITVCEMESIQSEIDVHDGLSIPTTHGYPEGMDGEESQSISKAQSTELYGDDGGDCGGYDRPGSLDFDGSDAVADHSSDFVWTRYDAFNPHPDDLQVRKRKADGTNKDPEHPSNISIFHPIQNQPTNHKKAISPPMHLIVSDDGPKATTPPTIQTAPLNQDHPQELQRVFGPNEIQKATSRSADFRKSKLTMSLSTGQLMKTFNLSERLGDGAFGSVWNGKSKLDSQSYAIKLIPFAQDFTSSASAQDLEIREVRTMAKMDSHPFVVRYYTAWIEEMHPFLYEKMKDIAAMQPEEDETSTHEAQFMNVPLYSDSESEVSERSQEMEKQGKSARISRIFEANCARKVRRSCSLTQQARISYEFANDWADIDAMRLDQSNQGASKSSKNKPEEQSSASDNGNKPQKQEINEVLIIQMELCDNGTLRDWLLEREEEDYAQSLHIFKQIVEALHHIHRFGVLHRDLKPENVFLCKRGGIKLGDFGLSMSSDERMVCNRFGVIDEDLTSGLGTPTYAAPEQLRQSDGKVSYSRPADIYPLGLIAYELLNVFETGMERAIALNELKGSGTTSEALKSEYNRMAHLIDAMILDQPEDRPTTTDILDLLEVECAEKQIGSPSQEFMKLGKDSESPPETHIPTPSNFRRASTHLLSPTTGATSTQSCINSGASSARPTPTQMELELIAKDQEIAMLRRRITMMEELREKSERPPKDAST